MEATDPFGFTRIVLVRPEGTTQASVEIKMPLMEKCPESPWWLEMSIRPNRTSESEQESDSVGSQARTALACECFQQGGCTARQPIAHNGLIQACADSADESRFSEDGGEVMWDHDSAETEHFGRCPHTVDMALIDSAGAVRAKTSVWFGIADMTFALDTEIAWNPSGDALICRAGIPLVLGRHGLTAIELGVDEGHFSGQLLASSEHIAQLYSVDAWSDRTRGHGHEQYMRAIRFLSLYRHRNTILRATFEEALDFFQDGFFDLVYIDGYAHTGQDGGQTLEKWWRKVKSGGMLAGHDYDIQNWPLTYHNVNVFANAKGQTLIYTSEDCDEHQSWMIKKPA